GRRYSFVQRLYNAGFEVTSYELDKYPPIAEICPIFPAKENWDEARQQLRVLKQDPVVRWYDYILPLNDQATFELANEPNVIGHNKTVAGICYDKAQF